jgi:hypothetical protein
MDPLLQTADIKHHNLQKNKKKRFIVWKGVCVCV